jgi:serine/threonine-protein kinase HipA
MHLKNFSLREENPGRRDFLLSDAYDMLPVNIVLPADREETALTLNGKKRNLRRKDFLLLAEHCDLSKKTAEKMILRLISRADAFRSQIEGSHLPNDRKEEMIALMTNRLGRLAGNS